MYINFEVLKNHGIDARRLLIIQGFKQSRTPEEREVMRPLESYLPELKEKGYLKQIKGKKSDDEFSKYRIDKKGREFLRDLEIANWSEESIALSGRLYKLYQAMGKEDLLDNKRELVRRVTWFLYETGADPDEVYRVVDDHLNNDDYTYKLNNFIYKPPNAYASGYNLAYSELYSRLKG